MKDFLAAIKKGEKAGYDSRSAEYNLVKTFKIESLDGKDPGLRDPKTGVFENVGTFMVDGEVYQGKSVKGSMCDIKAWQNA